MRHFRPLFPGRLLAFLLCACLMTGFFVTPAAQSVQFRTLDAEELPDPERFLTSGGNDTADEEASMAAEDIQDSDMPDSEAIEDWEPEDEASAGDEEELPEEEEEEDDADKPGTVEGEYWDPNAEPTPLPSGKQVLIYLQEAMPDNQPYLRDSRPYRRDIAVPVINGEKGFMYRKTTQVCHWLFPVSYADGTPKLYLSLESIKDPTSITVNEQVLSADKPVAVPLSETAELRVANDSVRGLLRVMFTSLPVIQLKTPGNIYKDVDAPATITVWDPDHRAHGIADTVTVYDAVVSRRGKSSSRFSAKHPYNFSLMKDGQKWDQSLLGLRNDSDWLLDSAYIDRSRMRNRVLMDIWHEIYNCSWARSTAACMCWAKSRTAASWACRSPAANGTALFSVPTTRAATTPAPPALSASASTSPAGSPLTSGTTSSCATPRAKTSTIRPIGATFTILPVSW